MIKVYIGSLCFQYQQEEKGKNYLNFLKSIGAKLIKKDGNNYYYSIETNK